MAKATTKRKITSVTIRENRKGDRSPKWENTEGLTKTEFTSLWHSATQYYNVELQQKDYKPIIVIWMESNGFESEVISYFKKVKDWRCNSTMACIADGLMKGMPNETPISPVDMTTWLTNKIYEVIENHSKDEIEEESAPSIPTQVINVQDRIRDTAVKIAERIDDVVDEWIRNPKSFKPANAAAILATNDAKPAHVKFIKEFYESEMAEITAVLNGDTTLKEGYSNVNKKQLESILTFYQDVMTTCDALAATKVRKAKPIDKDKAVSKLKYKQSDDILKLSSIDPVAIIGAESLWVFDTKTRKLGRYIANDGGLSVKGCTILNYNEDKSVQKILRKPSASLTELDKAGKNKKESFLSDINATETKLNGRINENVILLKL